MHGRPRLRPDSLGTSVRPLTAAGTLLLVVAAGVAGCSGGGPQAAPSASAAACSTALAAAPATVLGQARTALDVTGALGYGTPQIVVRCGLPALGPTSDPCLDLDGVFWVLTSKDGEDPVVLTAFGRSPAVDVAVPGSYGRQNASAVAVDLAPVVTALPSNGRTCQG